MAVCNPPSFKKILHDHDAPYLALPHNFVMRYMEDKIPEEVVIRSATGGFLWNVKVKKIKGSVRFDKGWKRVVKDACLAYEDTLLFWLVDETTFKMWIYGTDDCQKVLTPKIHVKLEEDVVDVSDDTDADGNGGDVDGSDGDGSDDGNGGDGSYGSEGGSDGSDGDGGYGNDKRFFAVTISESHKRSLGLPSHFDGLPGIRHKEMIIMKNLDGEEWEMGVIFRSNQYHLSRGWVGFKRDNKLVEGDECVFLFIRNEGKLCLTRVTKKDQILAPRAAKLI